ncbi:MAG: precorrin-6y C5,15-methyltransferase (decarboxylating) subunit CbiE [Selenomonas sp.]|uniref:precorrin-6y C5,15-methyltransferase (decarboxylating) subunit CbiE n=1 Tax=Selenomonas sp. TaxID=2053611 RepID=UPI0025CDB66C|nr:precorrin-6y C5,15-methyltransferase (decarboxylating) subunit CbiE [Selenomonas sp.]MCR5758556.1 precorrin-6y C5,15-methyltransferase (decarboxylating) subunit CbiE [Selenomonas sp.]
MDKQNKIIVIGIGPGNPDYIVPKGLQAIRQARFLVGGRRALSQFAQKSQETCPITADIQGVMHFIQARVKQAAVIVMVSGDPGYYSLLDALRREFPVEQLAVIPGISAMQYAFARLSLPWHDAVLASFHGRVPAAEAIAFAPDKVLGMLTDSRYNSQSIARYLIDRGWPETSRLHICSRLSYEDEEILHTTLQGALQMAVKSACILILEAGSSHT